MEIPPRFKYVAALPCGIFASILLTQFPVFVLPCSLSRLNQAGSPWAVHHSSIYSSLFSEMCKSGLV